MPHLSETDRKVRRLAAAAAAAGVDAVLLSAHWNFAWLTGGASNRIDVSREAGAGTLIVTADDRRLVLANEIEMPRLTAEALAGLGFESIAFPWIDERADALFLPKRAADVVGGGRLAMDLPVGDTAPFEAELMRLRTQLEPEEVERYRRLGAQVGRAAGDATRALPHGISEDAAIRKVGAAVLEAGARPLVLLAAADDRLLHYRHPIPTDRGWRERLMIAVCAERGGLVVALSRHVCAGRPVPELARRLAASQAVFAAMLTASTPGARAADVYQAAAHAYALTGYAGQEAFHHQGGGIGYKSREWIAHPRSRETLQSPTALAWNPSITGTKIEDTCLVSGDGVENLTVSPGWPTREMTVRGRTLPIPEEVTIA